MALNQKRYEHQHEAILRDIRPLSTRIADGLANPSYSTAIFLCCAVSVYVNDWMLTFADLIVFFAFLYLLWLMTRDRSLPFKLPMGAKYMDKNNGRNGRKGKPEGILYLGNTEKGGEEVWFTNSDIRTHILYLGTTGAGKTEGLKSLVTNALAWGSGFVYVDGKADTDLWSSLSSVVRRFGRDDDLLVLNYMTGNADVQAPSNTMNPFSSGSASYLTNMLVSLMPESGGDNAMWKERAVSLVGSMMPALTWKRDNQEVPLSVRTIRDYLSLNNVIKLSRDDAIPAVVREGLIGYLDTLPGFIGDAYDDEGKVKPPGPDTPQYNTETASQQHGYLAMQFTRSLQSLGDDYGYIFDTQAADVDMVDVVLNRRILVVLVPALEKSGDEVANLGKIVSASIKGMMGSTLGSTVEGDSAAVIENKPTHSSTPFMTVFDEVGYYVAEGMAVMAAQARSLGFCLVFAGQDLPAMKKRVREEAQSITANCNIKLFGKLEDPTETKDFFEKTVGSAMVTEVSGFQMAGGNDLGAYHDTKQASVQLRPRASYDGLRGFKEGQAVVTFGETVVDCAIFYSNPGFAKAMRVTRFMSLPPPDETLMKHAGAITKLRDLMVNKTWTASRADVAIETSDEIAALHDGFTNNNRKGVSPVDAGIASLIQIHALNADIPPPSEAVQKEIAAATPPPTPAADKPAAAPQQQKSEEKGDETEGKSSSGSGGGAGIAAPIKDEGDAAEKAEPKQAASPAKTESKEPKPAAANAPAGTKPAIFGGGIGAATASTTEEKPKAEEEVSTTSSGNAKPAIFGGGTSTDKPAEKQATDNKPATPKADEKEKSDTPEADTSASPAKPAIFGATKPAQTEKIDAPDTGTNETKADPAQKAEKKSDDDAVKKAAKAAQDALFGETPKPAEDKPTDTSSEKKGNADAPAKPAIFGASKPADPKPAEDPTASEPKESKDSTPKTEDAQAKPAIFGSALSAAQSEAPSSTKDPEKTDNGDAPQEVEQKKPAPAAKDKAPEKGASAKPAIFSATPAKEETTDISKDGKSENKDENTGDDNADDTTSDSASSSDTTTSDTPKKPAIFGKKPEKTDDEESKED